MSATLPYARIDTLFVDVGHTLVSPDFGWMARELAARGVACDARDLARADVELRVSEWAQRTPPVSSERAREIYLEGVFARLPDLARPAPPLRSVLSRELVPVLYPGGLGDRLWCQVIPGVREALARMTRLGLRMVIVSNADGSVERQLTDLALRSHFACVIDSHVVGVSKPDPAIFEISLARSGAERTRTLHVGDSYAADVLGARGAGIHPVLLDPHGHGTSLDCDALPDLLALAESLERATR